MHWITPALALALASTLACGDPPKTTDSGSGDSSSSGTASSSSSSTSASSSGTTDNSGSGGATEGQTTSSTTHNHTGTTFGPDTGSTGHGSTGHDASTGGSTSGGSTSTGDTSGSSGGGVCQKDMQSCAMGETCCPGLECCSGVPVPPGKEFCAQLCPISDRNAKTDLRAIDPQDVLRKVAALDITTWRYKKDPEGVRHLGPMAQDFRAAFGLWDTDTMIFPLDATGVSMAAIQGLHQRLVAAEAENDELRARLDRLERHLAALEAR